MAEKVKLICKGGNMVGNSLTVTRVTNYNNSTRMFSPQKKKTQQECVPKIKWPLQLQSNLLLFQLMSKMLFKYPTSKRISLHYGLHCHFLYILNQATQPWWSEWKKGLNKQIKDRIKYGIKNYKPQTMSPHTICFILWPCNALIWDEGRASAIITMSQPKSRLKTVIFSDWRIEEITVTNIKVNGLHWKHEITQILLKRKRYWHQLNTLKFSYIEYRPLV